MRTALILFALTVVAGVAHGGPTQDLGRPVEGDVLQSLTELADRIAGQQVSGENGSLSARALSDSVVVLYEGWDDTSRVVTTWEGAALRDRIERNPDHAGYTLDVGDPVIAAGRAFSAQHTVELVGDLPGSRVLMVSRNELRASPGWPLNWRLGPVATGAMRLDTATEMLIDEFHLQVLGDHHIWGHHVPRDLLVWQGGSESSTVRDLILSILSLTARSGRWYHVSPLSPNFDTFDGARSLAEQDEIVWAIGLGPRTR